MATTKKIAPKKAPGKRTRAAAKPEAEVKKTEGLEAPVYSMDGKRSGVIALPAEIFGLPWRADLVHQVTVAMQANARPTVANTKNRGEVAGGGKKPWKQKGTGRARHGSTRSPIWVGGGIAHGPRAERSYAQKINKKMRIGALLSVLSKKAKDGEVIFVDTFAFAAPKTKEAKAALSAIAKAADASALVAKPKNAALIAFAKKDAVAEKSLRNIGNIDLDEVRNLNPVTVMTHRYLIIENPAEAFKTLAARATR
ncbi:MAG: 50S ribosomal protein L4 [Patescibacteria group bacterium]|nr:50S ribosomal protein L4 [Patescibacteria group bacterium]MDE1966059.1 50S ribosomal protein L4 [Patescibacteria group bacterium]